jgi:hypothetical protein
METLSQLKLAPLAAVLALGALTGPATGQATDALPSEVRELLEQMIPAPPEQDVVPGVVLVKTRPSQAARLEWNHELREKLRIAQPTVHGAQFEKRLSDPRWTQWTIDPNEDPREAAERMMEMSGVVHAQPLNRIRIMSLPEPNDPDWGIYEPGTDYDYYVTGSEDPFLRLWPLYDTNMLDAWSVYPGKYYTAADKPADPPLIAVVDTGMDLDHPDYKNAGGSGTDVSQGGQINKAKSARVENGVVTQLSADDDHGHGTHVGGVALAAANNGGYEGNGMIGTGYNAQGMSVRVFTEDAYGTDADAAAAIRYAADEGADIISLSLGTESISQLLQDAVTYAWQKGSILVAAGNQTGTGDPATLGPMYPAGSSGVLGVTANGPNGNKATLYPGGGLYVDIAAPAGDLVLTTGGEIGIGYVIQYTWSTALPTPATPLLLLPENAEDYGYGVGTSIATPFVSGVLALYYGMHDLDQQDGWSNLRAYRQVLRSAATSPLGSPNGARNDAQGYGNINALGLLLEQDTRNASIGGITGRVYYNETQVVGVNVIAENLATGTEYSTTTQGDGIYKFQNLPGGEYEVRTRPFGAPESVLARAVAGSDSTGFDLWAGDFSTDESVPVVPRFEIESSDANGFALRHWGYDTETSIDSIVVRVGTTPGADDVMANTALLVGEPLVQFDGLSLNGTYYVTGTYSNGAELTTVVDAQFSVGSDAAMLNGTLDLDGYAADPTGLEMTLELYTEGTSTLVETLQAPLDGNAEFSVEVSEAGNYDVVISGDHWLRRRVASLTIDASGAQFAADMVNGDADGNNRVGSGDYLALVNAWGSTPGDSTWDASVDFDGNDRIGSGDFLILVSNYGQIGD